MGRLVRRAVIAVAVAAAVAVGAGACTIQDRPSDERQSVQTTPQPDPVTSRVPPTPPSPESSSPEATRSANSTS